jgi:hypothetical protein
MLKKSPFRHSFSAYYKKEVMIWQVLIRNGFLDRV